MNKKQVVKRMEPFLNAQGFSLQRGILVRMEQKIAFDISFDTPGSCICCASLVSNITFAADS